MFRPVSLKKLLGLLLSFLLLFPAASGIMLPQYSSAAEVPPRSFPDTTNTTLAFASGIGSNGSAALNNAQIEFIATHFVGDIDTPIEMTQKYREYNPDFIVFLFGKGC